LIRIWRLTRPEFAPGLDGEGARLYGGRWNSRGRPMIYCSVSLSLALFEVWVHLPATQRKPGSLPNHVKVGLDLPDDMGVETHTPDPATLADRSQTSAFGDLWLEEQRSAVLSVPSAILPEDRNFLLNPLHPDFGRVDLSVLEPFRFDKRLAT
jgi:RES domain-containing protein